MVQSLQEKHPASTGEVPQWVRDFTVDAPQRPPLTTDVLARAIHTAARASAAGPSGWVTEHLRDTFLTEPSCLPHLLEVFNQWVAGQVPERARPWLAASNLVGLSKPNGGVRPVAIGEVLPRILARALCISLRPAMASYFLPCNQLGAGTRVGVEILTHSFRILEAFGVLRERLEWVGLEVQAHKCRFWDVERALPLGMQRVEEGLTLVGVPIGEEDWEAIEQLPATIRQEMPGLPLCAAASPLRLFQARQQQLAVEELQALRRSARDDATLARFTSLQGPGAGAWVSAVSAHSDLTFTAAEWGIAAAIRLGLPIQQLQVAGRCVCGTAYVDPADPHHALRCKHQHGPSRVHDEVKFAVARISKASGGVVTMEDGVVLPGKRVDVAVRRPMAGEAHALEISVADPLSLSPSLLGQCGHSMGVAAREWERRKTSDYAPLLARNRGVQFTPLIVETWGCLDGPLQRAQACVILLRAASCMGGMNVDLVDREKEDVEEEGGALWVEARYMVDAQM
ncbi:unnamed protein product [Closterium sp. NIES-65]|nr:unnamed protein product [Closterium sp. NIES-65]